MGRAAQREAARQGVAGLIRADAAYEEPAGHAGAVYFDKLGVMLGPERIHEVGAALGVGVPTGIEVDESSGELGTPESTRERGGTGYPASSVVLGIGQGPVTATPIREGMRQVVVSGTENPSTTNGDTTAWMVAVGPSEAPRIAVAVMVRGGGHGGETAGPVARRALACFAARAELAG